MMVRLCIRLTAMAVVGLVLAGVSAGKAQAAWQQGPTTTASPAYNQGITFDQSQGSFYLSGIDSPTNSALYRTNRDLTPTGSNLALLPQSKEGYNHVGDLSFDSTRRHLLLPMECYDQASGGNTCGVGAFGVADPATLGFRYYVNLDSTQIQKAMWDEITPDGKWILTSSGTHLLAYAAAKVNQTTADMQRAGAIGGITGKDLGAVLPTSGVTGGAFYTDASTGTRRLLVSLNQTTYFQVVSYPLGTAPDGTPTVTGSPRPEISVAASSQSAEPEGLSVTGKVSGSYPLGGLLHWQMLPSIPFYSSILNYVPTSASK
jgi:hypothetical protein